MLSMMHYAAMNDHSNLICEYKQLRVKVAFQLPQNMYHKPLPTFLMKLRGDLVLGVFGQTQVVPNPSGALRRYSSPQYFR